MKVGGALDIKIKNMFLFGISLGFHYLCILFEQDMVKTIVKNTVQHGKEAEKQMVRRSSPTVVRRSSPTDDVGVYVNLLTDFGFNGSTSSPTNGFSASKR